MEAKIKNKELGGLIFNLTGLINGEPQTRETTDASGVKITKTFGLLHEALPFGIKNRLHKVYKKLAEHNDVYSANLRELLVKNGAEEIGNTLNLVEDKQTEEFKAELKDLNETDSTLTFDPVDLNKIENAPLLFCYDLDMIGKFCENG